MEWGLGNLESMERQWWEVEMEERHGTLTKDLRCHEPEDPLYLALQSCLLLYVIVL